MGFSFRPCVNFNGNGVLIYSGVFRGLRARGDGGTWWDAGVKQVCLAGSPRPFRLCIC